MITTQMNSLMKAPFPIDKFLTRAVEDYRLLPSHLSLFMAIFYYSKNDDPYGSFRITRSTLMRFAKIKSIVTYHKCLQDLADLGYIFYQPSYDTYKGSQITIVQN